MTGEQFLTIADQAAKKWRRLAEANGIKLDDLAYHAFIDGFVTGYATAVKESKNTEEARR